MFFDILDLKKMLDLINYLNSPHLVAAFQKIFGIEPTFESKSKSVDQPVLNIKKRSPLKKNEKQKEVDDNKQKNHKRTSSNPKKLVNITDHNHLIANTLIHNRFWYYFFHLGAAMGNEIFYCLFFPFWFWNVDGAIARKYSFKIE